MVFASYQAPTIRLFSCRPNRLNTFFTKTIPQFFKLTNKNKETNNQKISFKYSLRLIIFHQVFQNFPGWPPIPPFSWGYIIRSPKGHYTGLYLGLRATTGVITTLTKEVNSLLPLRFMLQVVFLILGQLGWSKPLF